ncbi:hypothetical protein [Spirochaeta africana]|uniref:Uncharacterized protein n=1 Tax=Spirochaeta africana (strain ATCC 700263 / DSM 8902 / Z-7692) TaxID=889378 RepID=H9UK32_SPIAZ|nr:hypothetical protein [Spirochaeta africana]AFG37875.1 hypothetical protein Spiaf_1818 [Spirochaeta africana DSM 8902]
MYERYLRQLVIAVLWCTVATFAAADSASVEYVIDWVNNRLTINAEAPVPDQQRNRAAARQQTTRDLENRLPQFLSEGVLLVTVDAEHRIGESTAANTAVLQHIAEIFSAGSREYSRLHDDLRRVQLRYHVPLQPAILAPLISQDRARPVPRRLGWTPRAEYSGILIYAAAQDTRGALLPRIVDRTGTVYHDYSALDPDLLMQRGMVLYSDTPGSLAVTERVGASPRRVTSIAVSGSHGTDIVLSDEDIHALLSTPSTRAALRQGRVAVILHPDHVFDRY